MLRKTKTLNIVAAISVIAILISSSIFAIPVFAQNDEEDQQDQQQQPGGVGSPQSNQTATEKDATLTFHDEMRRMWLEQDIYMRLMLVTYKSGNMEDFNATVAKALKAQDELVNFTTPYLGQTNTQNLSTALKMHIQIYTQILADASANDTAALNANLTLWYDNAKEISTLLETALSRVPSGNQTVPGGNQTIPGGNQTVPGGNQTVPGGNQTVPGGNQTQPGANQTQPAIIWILPDSAVNMSSVGFRPNNATVIIGVNNTVTWINNDTTEHTVVGVGGPTGAPMPNSSFIPPNQNYTFTFTVAGIYVYWCSVHTWMQGIVNVQAGQAIPGGNQTVPGGNQTIPGGNQTVPGGNQTIPGGNQTVPANNQLISEGNARILSWNKTQPGGNQTVPGGNQTIPGGNQTVPSGNLTKKAVIWIVNGSGTNTSSLGYSPANATVIMGVNDTVTWVNNDSSPHTVTSRVVPEGAQMFDSGILGPNENYTYTFTTVGTYDYFCSLHPWMMGNVTVMGNQTVPGGNQTVPGGNQTIPGGNQSIPGGNQSVPGDNQTIPGGNQTVPGGNQTVPGGNQTVPGGNQTIPGGNQTTGPSVNVSILQDMNTHLNLTMRMTTEYLNGNYTASLLTFQEIIKGTLKLADIISDAIIAMFPNQFTQIGTVSRP